MMYIDKASNYTGKFVSISYQYIPIVRKMEMDVKDGAL